MNASPSTRPTNIREWYAHVKVCAERYKVDKYLCLALARGESGTKYEEVRFRWVAHGKYHGPYNLCRGFFKYGDITDWRENTRIGIMALAAKLDQYGTLWNALRHYNTGDKGKKFEDYVNNIKKLKRQYEKQKVFEDEPQNLASKK